MLRKITDKSRIRDILDYKMQNRDLLASVYIKSKNTIYEGVKVMGAVTYCLTGQKKYIFSNGNSFYRSSLVSCDLEDIIYIEVL